MGPASSEYSLKREFVRWGEKVTKIMEASILYKHSRKSYNSRTFLADPRTLRQRGLKFDVARSKVQSITLRRIILDKSEVSTRVFLLFLKSHETVTCF